MKKSKVKKGDTVLVIAGKDKGKTGKVEKVFPKTDKISAAGINILKKATRPTKKNPHGGIIQFNAPIYLSNTSIICPRCNKTTRVGYKMLDAAHGSSKGKKIRICKKCGESVEQ